VSEDDDNNNNGMNVMACALCTCAASAHWLMFIGAIQRIGLTRPSAPAHTTCRIGLFPVSGVVRRSTAWGVSRKGRTARTAYSLFCP